MNAWKILVALLALSFRFASTALPFFTVIHVGRLVIGLGYNLRVVGFFASLVTVPGFRMVSSWPFGFGGVAVAG